ncbi:hypothetical protein CEUSTIGMA_g4910.t1 [Chlamydomonas eustigma]|uniref:DUF7781 domain-containing protein n=1 Tax=Chlamydomonas eustigma TaxID=1157962 RepID=A0A250X337_9CHLO|nr:hypothetical protein CEUSTIGMA_g4910.t1 [Chlamydomonas eustigma]|eukprot:GAX77466.1 hypothetical protein CEUSTIGMA_g4910.t1 [Chlamydomonas eustigma]
MPYGEYSTLEQESENGSVDPLDKLLENYNFECNPELRLKFIQQLPSCALGLCLAKPWEQNPRIRITIKPSGKADEGIKRVVQKLLIIPTHSQAALFSSKIQLGWLRLQGVVGYNWRTKKPSLDYRVSTKWNDGPRVGKKERIRIGNNIGINCKWNLVAHFPDMEGHIGIEDDNAEVVDVDWGHLYFKIPQVDLVLHSPVSLWGSTASHVEKRESQIRPKTLLREGRRLEASGGSSVPQRESAMPVDRIDFDQERSCRAGVEDEGERDWRTSLHSKWLWLSDQVQMRLRGESA